jgi:SAM-dependent methyltransferase
VRDIHPEALAFVARTVQRFLPPATVVDIGGRDVNGSPRMLFPGSAYLVVDLEDGPGVDVVADARQWRPESPVDLVLVVEVLEHAPDPEALLRASWAALVPGGRLIVTCATDPRAPHSGHDGGPLRPGEYYANIPPEELKGWLADWDDVEIEVHPDRGDLYAVAVRPRG